jgi:putative tryptophan/tyrosine transport system substrate-binding protein
MGMTPWEGHMAIHIERRKFIASLSGAAVAWSRSARAQQPTMPVIGFLHSASPDGFAGPLSAFLKGLGETGYVDGHNVVIEYRWAEGQYDRLPALAADLIHRKVTVVAATTTPAAQAAKAATTAVPVVFVLGTDPVKLGLVATLNRPGGNMTGVSNLLVALGSKQVGLLRQLAPGTTAIATLMNPNFPGTERQLRDVETAARELGLQFMVLRAATEPEIDGAFASMAQLAGAALLVAVDPFFIAVRDRIVSLAARHAIPAIYPVRDFAVAGGLMSYGTDFADSYRQAGIYTGRIVRGEKPADLPVQQSTKFEFLINMKTAKALGLEVPLGLSAAADEVIE